MDVNPKQVVSVAATGTGVRGAEATGTTATAANARVQTGRTTSSTCARHGVRAA